MLKNRTPLFIGFLQATALTIYVSLIGFFFSNSYMIDDKSDASFYAPVIMLLLFISSAVISAALVLGRFAVLFWEKKYRPAFTLLACTVFWIVFYLVAALLAYTYL